MTAQVTLTCLTVLGAVLPLVDVIRAYRTAKSDADRTKRRSDRLRELREEFSAEARATQNVDQSNAITAGFRAIHEAEGLPFTTIGNWDPTGSTVAATLSTEAFTELRRDLIWVISGLVCGGVAGVWSLWV